jgi:hypothetical protein
MGTQRIYRVDERVGDTTRAAVLVRAPNAAQAVRHVAKRFTCRVASQEDLVLLAGNGVKVQQANEGDDS